MKFATCRYDQQAVLALVADKGIFVPARVDPAFRDVDMQALIESEGRHAASLVKLANEVDDHMWQPLSDVELLAPLRRPPKNVMCLGWNYLAHAAESAAVRGREAERPDYPIIFTKAATSINGPCADIPLDERISAQLDWEVELAVIIGRGGRRIDRRHALAHVFGYTVVNDISARDLQFRHKQYFMGKSLDGACPMGPWIVSAEEIPDPQSLTLTCRVNGETKQHANTAQMIFSVAEIIEMLSNVMTLEAGDVIATGTPSGVGFARQPPEFLKPGDIIESEIEKVGTLVNRVVAVAS